LTIAQMHATSNTELIRLTRTWSFVKALGFSEMEALALVLASKLEYAEQLLRTATELATVDDRPLDGLAAENAIGVVLDVIKKMPRLDDNVATNEEIDAILLEATNRSHQLAERAKENASDPAPVIWNPTDRRYETCQWIKDRQLAERAAEKIHANGLTASQMFPNPDDMFKKGNQVP
jgi:hypothetical protein